jgi:hypothetical protein
MGRELVINKGVVEYCYVGDIHIGGVFDVAQHGFAYNDKTYILTATVSLELRSATKVLLDTVSLSVVKEYLASPTVKDRIDFLTNEVKAAIKAAKEQYSGYVET